MCTQVCAAVPAAFRGATRRCWWWGWWGGGGLSASWPEGECGARGSDMDGRGRWGRGADLRGQGDGVARAARAEGFDAFAVRHRPVRLHPPARTPLTSAPRSTSARMKGSDAAEGGRQEDGRARQGRCCAEHPLHARLGGAWCGAAYLETRMRVALPQLGQNCFVVSWPALPARQLRQRPSSRGAIS